MPVILTTIATAIGAGFTALTAGFTLANVAAFILKAGALIGLQFLLRKREPERPIPDVTQTQTFSSGPARWVLGRARVGGVVCYATVDQEVPRTALGGKGGDGKASDLHLVLALSEGECDAIEAVYIGDDRFDLDFTSEGHYARRGYKSTDTDQIIDGLGVILKQEQGAWYHAANDEWLATSPYNPDREARVLDEEDEDDAELIRISRLATAVTIWPYMNSDIPAANRFRSVRYYTARDFNSGDGEDALWNTETEFGKPWTTAHSLDGLAGVHIKLRQNSGREFDKRAFRSGFPNLSFLVRGLRVSFPNPSDSGNTQTTAWTDNAAAIRYWWHRQRLDIPASAIDVPAFLRAYEHCNTKITPTVPDIFPGYTDDNKPEWATNDNLLSFRRYSINGVLASGEKPSAIESEFDDAWQGHVIEDGGKLYYYPGGVNTTEVDTIEGVDLLDYPIITPAPSITERTNAVSINIEQSSFLDFQSQAIRDIVDDEKLVLVDEDLYLPADLGTFRWITNPAQAYLIGIINLRRARATTTFTLRLPPGNIRTRSNPENHESDLIDDDPIKYITMSVGQLYSVTIPAEEIEGRQMMLIEKSIDTDFTVNATFVDSPAGLYDGSLDLPALDPPPRYVPSRMGSRPPKPTGLSITSKTTIGDDGTWEFEIDVSVDDTPLPVQFRLVTGEGAIDSPATPDGEYRFKIIGRRQEFRVQARSIDTEGIQSLPTIGFHTPSYANIVLPQAIWSRVFQLGANLQITFESVAYSTPISGVELRYRRVNTGEPPTLTLSNWESDGELLETNPVQILRGLDITVSALLVESGVYNIYARFVSPISGVTKTRGPISQVYRLEYQAPAVPIVSYEEAPLWPGEYWNLYKWTATAGDTEGYPLMFPAHQAPANTKVKDWDAVKYDHWNGNTSTTITAEPVPAWPFGNCAGYDQALDETGRTSANGQLLDGGTSTWYRTLPVDLGTTKAVDVRAEIFSYAPNSGFISNLTFAGATVLPQVWLPNAAITPITLPAARSGIGTISYTIEGVPAGITLSIARVLSGTVSVGSATGTATLIARDAGGGEARLSFSWSIITGISAPIRVNTPTISNITQTEATITWAVVAGASYYRLAYTPSGGSEVVFPTNIFSNTHRLTGLTTGTAYSVKVQAVNNSGPGTYSPSATFTTAIAQQIPGVPTDVRVGNGAGIEVAWAASADASTYIVRWKKSTDAAYSNSNMTSDITTNTYTIQLAVLEPSVTYNVQVRAVNSAGQSDYSPALNITTLGALPNAPSITQVRDGTSSTPSVFLTISSVSGQNLTQVGVKADPTDGVYNNEWRVIDFASSPFEIFNVIEGYTYTFRARKRVTGNRLTAWSSEFTYVKGDVPERPAFFWAAKSSPSRIIPETSRRLSWGRTDDSGNNPATSYRIRYWPKNLPINVREFIKTPVDHLSRIQSTQTTVLSLGVNNGDMTWVYEVNGTNDHGHGLPLRFEDDIGTVIAANPHAPTNLVSTAIGGAQIHLNWDNNVLNITNDARSEVNYEIRATGANTVTGITNTHFNVSGLASETDYVFQIRAKYTHAAAYSAWVTFPTATTEPATVSNRYTIPSTASLQAGQVVDVTRFLRFSFTLPVTSNLSYFQIRYREMTELVDGRGTSRGRLPEWQYFNVANTFTTGTRTFSGNFDPGFSRTIYDVQIRGYLSADDSTLDGDKGFGEWATLAGSQGTVQPFRDDSNVSLGSLVYSGYEQLSTPVINVEQMLIPETTDKFYLQIDWDNIESDVEWPATYRTRWSIFHYRGTGDDRSLVSNSQNIGVPINTDSIIYGRNAKGIRQIAQNDTIEVNVTRQDHTLGPLKQPQPDSTRRTITYTVTAQPVLSVGNVTGLNSILENEDIVFWVAPEVPEADGYEFTLLENVPNAPDQRSTTIVQTSTSHTYRKVGGRNELFTVRVRAYHGSGNNRLFSATPFSQTYAGFANRGDDHSLQEITGLRATRDSDSTDITWNTVTNASNLGYECQYSTDNGATWLTNTNRYRSTNSFSLNATDAPLTADVQVRVRAIQGTTLSSPTNVGRSWTTIGFKAVSSSETGGGPGRIREVVALTRDDRIHLAWSDGTGTFNRYLVEQSASADSGYSSVAAPLKSSTEWRTNYSGYFDRYFRIRESTDEGPGDWSYIFHTAETNITIGAVPVVDAVSTYVTIAFTWSPAPNAVAYDVQYKKSTDTEWTSHLSNHSGSRATTITGLDIGTNYNVRVRGVDGSFYGPWFSESESTLTCTGLTAPTFEFTITANDLRATWTAVTAATAYEIEVSVGNTVHKTETVTGTSKTYTTTDFPNITFPANVSLRMKSLLGDCPNSNFGSKITKTWSPSAMFSLSTNTTGTSSNPHILSGGSTDGNRTGQVQIPKSYLVPGATIGPFLISYTYFSWTIPRKDSDYRFTLTTPDAGSVVGSWSLSFGSHSSENIIQTNTMIRRRVTSTTFRTTTGNTLIITFTIFRPRIDNQTYPLTLTIERESTATGTITNAITAGATGATINADPSQYTITEDEPITELVRPYFSKALEYQIWQTGEAVNYQLPEIVGGKAPYRILANDIPGGITFDSDTRTFSGSITNAAPDTGYTTIDLIDANDLIEKVYLPWAIATTAQPTPVSGSGFGLLIHPFEISCLLKGNMRSYLGSRANGGTNAADIVANTTHARNLCTWYQCPTRGAKFVRLRKAAAPDFDLVVKIGDTFHFSDTTDEDEFIRYDDSDHVAGALIGIYKYNETTVTSGLTETSPQPIILEWGPQVDTPTETSGEAGGALATGMGYGDDAEATNSPDGFDDSEIYVLWRSGTSGAWTKQGPITDWVSIKVPGSSNDATNVRQLRFEGHLKKWRNRAMIRFNTAWRDG